MNDIRDRADEFEGRPELVKKRARAIYWQRLGISVLVIYCVLTLSGIALSSIVSIKQRAELQDCITPHGKCFKAGAKRSAKLVNGLNTAGEQRTEITRQVVVVSAACASDLPNGLTVEERRIRIQTCVNVVLPESVPPIKGGKK